LANDIECKDSKSLNNGQGFISIGEFTGALSGLSDDGKIIYKIKNLSNQLFSVIKKGAKIHDLILTNVNITGLQVSALVGSVLDQNTTIRRVYIDGTINTPEGEFQWITGGGAVNVNQGIIDQVSIKLNMKGTLYRGFGGLVWTNYGTVSQSSADVNMNTLGDGLAPGGGGLVFENRGTIIDSYATGTMISRLGAGLTYTNTTTGIIKNSYSTVNLKANVENFGGLAAFNSGVITHSYWDTNVSGQIISAGGEGKSTSQMKQKATFVGWDFDSIWKINNTNSGDYPRLRNTLTIPIEITNCQQLQDMQKNTDGDYILANDIDCTDTKNWNKRSGFIPIGGQFNGPFFSGNFDGKGFKIDSLFINNSGTSISQGLWGSVTEPAKIKNVKLTNLNVLGFFLSNSGGVAGYVRGAVQIQNVSVQGTIANGNAGGIVGWNEGGSIEKSSADVNIINNSGFYAVSGGIVGFNKLGKLTEVFTKGNIQGCNGAGGLVGGSLGGTIKDSYSIANVTLENCKGSSGRIGGLVGYSVGETTPIENSYASGKVSVGFDQTPDVGGAVGVIYDYTKPLTSVYWDKDTTLQFRSANGPPENGKTTREMYKLKTFAGWDFSNVWRILEGQSYPHLKWEPVTLTIKFTGYAQGSITTNPTGIACSGQPTCTATFSAGTKVLLYPSGQQGTIFQSLTTTQGTDKVSCSSAQPIVCSIILNQDAVLNARFDLKANASVDVTLVDQITKKLLTANGTATLEGKDRKETIKIKKGKFSIVALKSQTYTLKINVSGYVSQTQPLVIMPEDQDKTKVIQYSLLKKADL